MSFPAHLRATLALGLPLIGGHLAEFAIGLTDTVMLGWYGVEPLAAATLSREYFFFFFMPGAGFALAVMPLVAAAAASGDETGLRRATRMGMWLSLGFALLAMAAMWGSGTVLRLLGQGEQVAADAQAYLRIAGWGLIPALQVMVLKSCLAALGRTRAVLWITLLAAGVNALLNYALIFGHWGAPELGLAGAAIASLAAHLAALVAVAAYAAGAQVSRGLFRRLWRADGEMLGRVFRLGVPIGMTMLSEVSLFVAATLMMGWIGTVPLAAHGIVLTLSSGTFMVHLGLSNAATIRSGTAFGRREPGELARGAQAAIALSMGWAVLTVIAFLTLAAPVIGLFVDPADPARGEILAAGVTLLAIAALFQLVDGAQVIALGLLRGVQDTAVPMVVAVAAYWAIGVPVSYLLGFRLGLGGPGIWLGLVCGLAAAGIFLMLRFWRRALPGVARRATA